MLWKPYALVPLAAAVPMALATACSSGDGDGDGDASSAAEPAPTIEVSTPAFEEGASIPERYTCDGADLSPPINWEGVPEGTRSIALVVDDPDAGGWIHWVIYTIPPDATGLPEGMSVTETTSLGAMQGENDFDEMGYRGPCPPGGTHTYVFTLYGLDTELDLEQGAKGKELLSAVEGHVLGVGRLTGTYQRSR